MIPQIANDYDYETVHSFSWHVFQAANHEHRSELLLAIGKFPRPRTDK